ncbi:hypothetical protein [Streptomyces sp. BK340]|uniref:hypothetical protein n=1 Tax=Streptomyces sp. BK340 TaxID=2572903 RepID=UPI0011A8B7B3|nr:hypothetical protein [Streptomyces sp. BK340]TVZ96512.1 hypothetical protein FB157_103423 [Streptomyces sp. BK340]
MATTLYDTLARATQQESRQPRIPAVVTRAVHRATTQVRATASRLSGSLLTVTGLGCIDVGAFEAHPIAGWITTGVTVLLLDWKLDPPPSGGDV